MSVHVTDKLSDKHDVVMSNGLYFNLRTKLNDTEFTRFILKDVDKAQYLNEYLFLDRSGRPMPKDYLSTGAKTMINIAEHPNTTFFVGECGVSALASIAQIHDGNVYWPEWVISMITHENFDCDIEYNGVHYNNFEKFLERKLELDDEE